MSTVIPFPIMICGIDELPSHSARGISHVLSILDPDWPVPDAFGRYGEHARLELRFHDVIEPHPRAILPRREHVEQILAFGRDLMSDPAGAPNLLVHCHAGVSRSTASMLLLTAQALPHVPPARLAEAILELRPQAWPNLLIAQIGDELLGRGGAIVEAVTDIYRTQLRRRPDYAAEMESMGRGREVALGRAA